MNRPMYIGLDLKECVADILCELASLEEVERIDVLPSDRHQIETYKQTTWSMWPEKAEKVFRQLEAEGKLVEVSYQRYDIKYGHWLYDGQHVRA